MSPQIGVLVHYFTSNVAATPFAAVITQVVGEDVWVTLFLTGQSDVASRGPVKHEKQTPPGEHFYRFIGE